GSCQPPLRPGDSRTGPAFTQEGTHPERFDPALAVYSQDGAPRHSLYLRPSVRRWRRRRLRVATTLTLRDPGTPEPGALKRRAREQSARGVPDDGYRFRKQPPLPARLPPAPRALT